MDFLSSFINALVKGGVIPKSTKDFRESASWRRIAAANDKNGQKSISYWLRIEYDFAYGYAKDHKGGCEVSFKSYNNDASLTRADMARIKAMMKARQAAQDAAIAGRHAKIAERAKVVYSAAVGHGITPYTERKKVGLIGARIIGDKVIVPIYDGAELVSWQMIRADGSKKFPFGGKKQGCWNVLGQIDPMREFYICEGWATGVTIHTITGKPVVVAFDAGNLLPVAKALRKIYNCPIIIAADNDKSGVGLKAAEAVKKSVAGCTVIMPKTINSDFNDDPSGLMPEKGRETASENPPGENLSPKEVRVQSAGGDWMGNLSVDAKNRMIPSSLKNAAMYMTYHDDWRGVFRYDEFKNGTMVMRSPPWESGDDFNAKRLTDVEIVQTAIAMESYGLVLGKDRIAQAIEVVAHENKFHSARSYFNALKWDGVCRLETMFFDHFGSTQEHAAYLAFVAIKWMTAAIKRIMMPGCKFDHVLIMESAQGISKSSALKCLVTFGEDERETYHTDAVNVSDHHNPHAALKLQGSMIVELAELKGFSQQDDAAIKNWITQQFDEIKLPYDRYTTRYPRQFVFAATTNKHDYLKDPTGNRRYWPITVEKLIDLEKLTAERDQLWAEAVWNWKAGMYIGPTPEENELAEVERQKRLNQDPWEDKILSIVDRVPEGFKTSDILDKMQDLRLSDKNEMSAKRVSSVLQMNGFDNKVRRNGISNKTERVWVRK